MPAKGLLFMSNSFLDYQFLNPKDKFIAGCDEVGRGPLAGPVVASCVYLDISRKNNLGELAEFLGDLGVKDSKKVSHIKRKLILEQLFIKKLKLNKVEVIRPIDNLYYSVSSVGHQQIDRINILQASLQAMKKSFYNIYNCDQLKNRGSVLIDGKFCFETTSKISAKALVKGDQKSVLIALASLIAKNYRDDLMESLNIKYPGFGFEKNAGYPTKEHLTALKILGPSEIHRKSFAPVRKIYEK